VVRVVFIGAGAWRPVPVSDWRSRHLGKITMFYHFDRTRVAGQSETESFLVGTVYARHSSMRSNLAGWRENYNLDRAALP
jgi:hypothetical protein